MSVHHRSLIVAAITIISVIPVFGGKHLRYQTVSRKVAHLTCVQGQPIPATAAAKKLHVVGKRCARAMHVRVLLPKRIVKGSG